MKYSTKEVKAVFLITCPDSTGLVSQPKASKCATGKPTASTSVAGTPAAAVPEDFFGETSKIAATAAEAAEKVSLLDDKVSLVGSSGILL